ncbi:periplasmic binding protein-like II [Anaeromyces robustus]|uniref:Periplasmic binding protein-like II n=1 Tax=Anaeromyces robustus TaxID=1754192 RepID=A0A1Y1X2L1_9FUNG|nr:periplasmic binding protein-like II [Anaeromyces robustus]|eukprot:ORX79942.1 periplasmic binding protein-like II [Anaeromyces robustus]
MNINIRINLNLLSASNTTFSTFGFSSMIESLLKKKSPKYDIYFYDSSFISKYGPYLIDLQEWLPEEHINIYDQNIINQTCIYNDKLVGLPIVIQYTALYSNKELLDQYGKKIPQTWQELLETAKYIKENEKNLHNNTDLIGYNGLFSNYDDDDQGITSIYEFMYSFRKSVNSSFPDFYSKSATKSLEMMKTLKEEIASGLKHKFIYKYINILK